MGTLDKLIRIIIVILIAILYSTATITGTLALIALIVAGIIVITSFISFCSLHATFGINTRKKQ